MASWARLPQGQIQQFLDKHVPAEGEVEADDEAEAADVLAAEGDAEGALERLQQAVAIDPANDAARFEYIKLLMQQGRVAEARQAYEPVATKALLDQRIAALRTLDRRSRGRAQGAFRRGARRRYRRQPARLRCPLRRAPSATLPPQRWTAAMDELLEILMRDKAWKDELARKTYVAILELMSKPAAEAGRRPEPAARPRARSRSPASRLPRRPPIRWSTSTGASSAWRPVARSRTPRPLLQQALQRLAVLGGGLLDHVRRQARRGRASCPRACRRCAPAPASRARTACRSWAGWRRRECGRSLRPASSARNPASAPRPSASACPASSRPNSNLVSAMIMPLASAKSAAAPCRCAMLMSRIFARPAARPIISTIRSKLMFSSCSPDLGLGGGREDRLGQLARVLQAGAAARRRRPRRDSWYSFQPLPAR